MKIRTILLVCMVFLIWALPAQAQSTYDVELTQLDDSGFPEITLYMSVTDASGAPVGGLTKQDFHVLEDGKEATIIDFAGTGEARPVDVVFVFDTTGSMGGEVEGVKDTCISFAQELESQGRDYRLGLVTFWDDVRGVYESDGSLTDDVAEFKSWIETIHPMSGEGDGEAENDFGALKRATQMQFRGGAQRVFILITDAPAHHYGDSRDGGVTFDDPDLTIDRTVAILQGAAATVYVVAEDDAEFQRIASDTGGRFYDLDVEPDFTGIIDEIGGIIARQFRLVYRSARPTHDGTRRGILVRVGGSGSAPSGETEADYLEKHLVNIESKPGIAAIFLAPLLAAAAVPGIVSRLRARRSTPISAAGVQPARDVPASPWPSEPPPAQQPAWPGQFPTSPTPSWPSQLPPVPPPAWQTPAPPSSAPPMPPSVPATPHASCPRCGVDLRPGAHFCGHCGHVLPVSAAAPPAQMCTRCGNPVRAGATFCGKCGNPLR